MIVEKKESSVKEISEILLQSQNILILTHKNPDGDTLGSGYALYYALREKGINSQVICSDETPKKYEYLSDDYEIIENFKEELIVSVDVADIQLLGDKLSEYSQKIDVCIDHHISREFFARYNCINAKSGANCENIYYIILEMGVEITPKIAECLYTGISTDTGCFKFSNTTSQTHLITALIMETGFDYKTINKEIFETKSKGRIELESKVTNATEFFEHGKIALIVIPLDLIEKTKIDESEIDGISSIPRQIEGVEVGITIREKKDGFKISVRTSSKVRANEICAVFSGGGHKRASGCFISKPLDEVKKMLVEATLDIGKNKL